MVRPDSSQDLLISELFDTALEVAYPDRFSAYDQDDEGYRMPLDRLSGYLDNAGQDQSDGQGPDLQVQGDWPPALKAAYRDGYDPLLPLGSGSSASVWRCIDRSFGREVAIKFPHPDSQQDTARIVEEIQGEAELLGQLQHPGIVQAVRRAGLGRATYLAIDFVDGDNLLTHSELMDLDGKARLRLFARALDAVAYLHQKEIVHGDLKPDHILVREDNQPVLIDFGLSSVADGGAQQLWSARRVGGSGRYRAPEIADGSATSPRAAHDVYALGVLLADLMRGVDLGGAKATIDEAIAAAMQPDPADRPSDAKALLHLLQPALTTRPLSSTVLTTDHANASMRWLWPVAALVMIGLGLGSLMLLTPDAPQTAQPQEQADGENALPQFAAQPSLLDRALQDAYAGDVQAALDTLEDQPPMASAGLLPAAAGAVLPMPWEERFIRGVIEGRGEVHPFGDQPYQDRIAPWCDFDPESETLVYARLAGRGYELWVRSRDHEPQMLYAYDGLFGVVAVSPGGEHVAAIKRDGETMLWSLEPGGLTPIREVMLTSDPNNKTLWFADDRTLCVFAPENRSVACWRVDEDETTDQPAFVIHDCDRMYRLSSGQGLSMFATAGDEELDEPTQLRVIDTEGRLVRTLVMEDSVLPASADMVPGENGLVCLGMRRGYVRIYREDLGGWLAPSDLGRSVDVSSMVIAEQEGRIFAGSGRVHLLDLDGNLLMRLGERDRVATLILRLDFDPMNGTLWCSAVTDFWACVGSELPGGAQGLGMDTRPKW